MPILADIFPSSNEEDSTCLSARWRRTCLGEIFPRDFAKIFPAASQTPSANHFRCNLVKQHHGRSLLCVYNHDINTLRPRRNGQHFADDIFKRIFFNENVRISIKISLKFVPKGPVYNIQALVQIMAWRRPGDKPLSEPMMVSLPTHICVTRPQWVNIIITMRLKVTQTG